MKWSTPWRVLIANREAILEAAGTRWTLLVGAILVLSASLARKYDTVDLLAEPYELLHGLAAAMVNAMGLHLLFWLLGSERPRPPFWSTYLSFLGVFMLAAPMGWVYGIPYEQFWTAPEAVTANLRTLAVVSLVRLIWMTRVLNVLWGVTGAMRSVGTFFAMMIYCDAVALVALMTAPLPTFDLMGGLQRPTEVQIVADAAFQAGVFAAVTAPIWLLVGLPVLCSIKRHWSAPTVQPLRPIPTGPVLAALAAVIAWASLLPMMQKPPQNRTRFESLLAAGQTAEAIHELCGRERDEYPPVWSPPPRLESREYVMPGELPAIAAALRGEANVPAWVDEVYGAKMTLWSSRLIAHHGYSVTGFRRSDEFAPRDSWAPTDLAERVNHWRRLDESSRPDVLTCLEFIRDRMTSLTPAEREELDRWIIAHATFQTEEREKTQTDK